MASIFDDNYFITPLSQFSYSFPNPLYASDEGLLAYGGGLEPNRLLNAYKRGIFPWFNRMIYSLVGLQNPRLYFLYSKDFPHFPTSFPSTFFRH